ncbi:carbohydrate ABC transporter permease [Oceanispirochaeta sp. M2]|nr:carbohydrate ABC transporter permease [Oceanispirochaeta sp. M2]NPD73369.1 carbohydrate ABC transporter permease [Oceanispirochaeta sp. M1]RDG31033.1 carbohydrate ABC transporter permease [Oceanispirochaeta sp. M1]
MRIVMLLISIIVAGPILWAFITSFKTSAEFLRSPWILPAKLQFVNYVNAVQKAHMGQYFINSIAVTFVSLAFLLFLVVPASYALARQRFFGSKMINLLVLAGLFINANYIVVPLFILLKNLNSLDNRLMLCAVYAATAIPFNVYLLSGFMKGISREYEDAANIDGCGPMMILYRIIVPMAKPGLITVSLFGFMTFWNEYMLALTLLTTPGKRTLSVGLKNLMEIQKYATNWGAMFAGLVIVMLPTMIFYASVQKKLTDGITLGGIKG